MIFREISYPDDPYTPDAMKLIGEELMPNIDISNATDFLVECVGRNNNYCVELEDADRPPVAYGSLGVVVPRVGPFGGIVIVENIVVAPESRGLGIGHFLLDSLEDEAIFRFKAETATLISLDSARGFYESRGYTSSDANDPNWMEKNLLSYTVRPHGYQL